MPPLPSAAIKAASAGHPRAPNTVYTYGTAGFRTKADVLDSVLFRVGLLAVLRSRKAGSQVIGAMITASHNPEEDNGVKLVDPLGEMLVTAWETHATALANAPTEDALVDVLSHIVATEAIDLSAPGKVVVGRDTRVSGPALTQALKDGIAAIGGDVTDYNLLSTPQLHYIVRCLNTAGTPDAYGVPTEAGYYEKLGSAFKKFAVGKRKNSALRIDAANGVGALKMKGLMEIIGESLLTVEIYNDDIKSKGKLNHDCGADYVKLHQKQPSGLDLAPGIRACSFDGDADRIVYYYQDQDNVFHLLDGDKIATLVAAYIIELVRESGMKDLQVGVVQTAYANGSSTNYITNGQKIPVACVETGVKHLHHAAAQFDVGVYFEANGHGTVLFSPKTLQAVAAASAPAGVPAQKLADLRNLIGFINQTVGDALSDLLIVEGILMARGWDLAQWDAGYRDLPSRQEKVKVSNRGMFKCTKADTVLVAPAALQPLIDAQVAKYQSGRCFVRPSGTEDIVRVYAEADTQENCDRLAYTVAGLVWDGFGGVGDRPNKYIRG